MDTRTKIVSAAMLPTGADVVTGYFDPVHAVHARRLRELRRPEHPLIVIVRNTPSPLLPWRARAELVAALEPVTYVLDSEHCDVERVLDVLAPARVTRDEQADNERTRDLIAYVHERSQASS